MKEFNPNNLIHLNILMDMFNLLTDKQKQQVRDSMSKHQKKIAEKHLKDMVNFLILNDHSL